LIENGFDGFIFKEHYKDERSYDKIKRVINALLQDEAYAQYIRENAERHSQTWDAAAKDWVTLWDDFLGRRKRKKAVISAYYSGHENLGDEAILTCTIKDIKGFDPEIEIIVASGDPFATESVHKVRAIPAKNYRLQADEVEKSDIAILGGGGVFQDHGGIRISGFFEDHKSGVTSFANLPLMSKIYNKPLVYYSQGVGPLYSSESRHFCRWAFEMADIITVRDQYSYNMLTELLDTDPSKVKLSYDPVLKSEIPPLQRARAVFLNNNITQDRKIVCVSVRYWIDKSLERKVIEGLNSVLREFMNGHNDYHIILIPFQRENRYEPENDVMICEAVSRGLPSESFTILRDYKNHEEILALYSMADFSIGMRYHSLILSAAANTPMIALSYDIKDDALMKELSLDTLCMSIDNINPSELLEKINYIRDNLAVLKNTLSDNISNILAGRYDSCLVLDKKYWNE
jgi:polysaccharide pyruvyl transferase CsaB